MTQKIKSILKRVLEDVKPSKEEIKEINEILSAYLEKINKNIKASKISAEIFIGGSFAKKTLIRKDHYDIDIFLRFDKKYEDISKEARRILKGVKYTLVHGSRDYFRVKAAKNLYLEFVPVKKVKNPREAENVTDLSYSHVNYIKRKVKSEKLLDEIRLTKAFCYANKVYGAESYIRGFSGYSIELLVYHYGSFLNFLKKISKIKKKEIIDMEKHHKTKSRVLIDINAAKLQSPIILIDPTYKTRNALAALSGETLKKFQKECKKFLKNPTLSAFKRKIIDLEKIKRHAKKKKYEFLLLEIGTRKQEGDIAGSKLLKFYRHLDREISQFFEIKAKGFEYSGDSKNFLCCKKEKRSFNIWAKNH
jgi:tRNA nucleotidyltransferase (CCA-adding enzyme)